MSDSGPSKNGRLGGWDHTQFCIDIFFLLEKVVDIRTGFKW